MPSSHLIFTSCFVGQSLNRAQFFATPWTEAHQVFLSFTISQSLPKFISPNPTILSSVTLFSSCPQSFPSSEFFPGSQLFASGGQSFGGSASVLPVNIQDWFPLELIDWFDLPAISRTLKSLLQHHNSSALSLLSSPALTSVHHYWKNHSFDYTDFCLPNNVFAL